jgi:hypothetical protein
MTVRTCVGTLLVEEGAPMPATLGVSTEHYAAGWSSIVGYTGVQLSTAIENAGWTFFYMAGEIHTSGFGFTDQSRTDRALARVIDIVRGEHCNCLEITQIRKRSFLGLHWTSLVAHARHIQRSCSFYAESSMRARIPFTAREWLYDQPAKPRPGSKSYFPGEAVQTWENEGGSRA